MNKKQKMVLGKFVVMLCAAFLGYWTFIDLRIGATFVVILLLIDFYNKWGL